MPSFLSRVFGRKKDDKEPSAGRRTSTVSLLEGKFEAVSPNVSLPADKLPEVKDKEKGKEIGLGLLRTKSATPVLSPYVPSEVPHLSLNLPGPKNGANARSLGVVFEADPDSQILLSQSDIGARRLNPLETLILVRACSQAIVARGLETPGLMHPHWYSANPQVQKRLISLFVHSLAPKSPITTLSPTLSSPTSAFESEIDSTRSPHDIAAVLRWGLRHLQLEGNSFGKDQAWYKIFFDTESSSQYPLTAFADSLTPQLPPAHLELLTTILDLFSSLAAHSEANSTSGSKVSKLLGLWLLETARAEDSDTWSSFYARWERAGRMMEHIFLSNIRQEMVKNRMPKRLTELVKQYPYSKSPTDEDLLPRPWFSTRQYDALYVHVDTELPTSGLQNSYHPLRLISDAFKAQPGSTDHIELWNRIKQVAAEGDNSSPGSYSTPSRVFADETIRFLSLLPMERTTSETPTLNLVEPTRKRSFAPNEDRAAVAAATNGINNGKLPDIPSVPLSTSMPSSTNHIGMDWAQFSTSGFLESLPLGSALASTLMDSDLEVTVPPEPKKSKLPTRRNVPELNIDINKAAAEETSSTSKVTSVSSVQLDETFIDFWNDALVDPISSDWPSFVICKLKGSLSDIEIEGKRVEWVVLEQTFSKPPPPLPPVSETHVSPSVESPGKRPRASSPKPSFKSDISGTFSSTRKRFSFWTGGDNKSPTKRKNPNPPKSPKIGEMGEILKEQDGDTKVKTKVTRKSVDVPKDIPEEREPEGNASGVGAATTATAVGATVVLAQAAVEVTSAESKEVLATEVVTAPESIPNETDISVKPPAPTFVADPVPATATAPVDEVVIAPEVKAEEAPTTESAPEAAVPAGVPPPVSKVEDLASESALEVISPVDATPVLEEVAAPISESEGAPVRESSDKSPLTLEEPVTASTEESTAIPEERLGSIPVDESAITSVEDPVMAQVEPSVLAPTEGQSANDVGTTKDIAPTGLAATVPIERLEPLPVDEAPAPSVAETPVPVEVEPVKNGAPVEHVADSTEESSVVVQQEDVPAPAEEHGPLSLSPPVTTDVVTSEVVLAPAPEEQDVIPAQAEEPVSLQAEENALPTVEEGATAVEESSVEIGATAPAEETVETSSTDPEVVGNAQTPIVEDKATTPGGEYHLKATPNESVPAPASSVIDKPDVAAAVAQQPGVLSGVEPETVAPVSDSEDKPSPTDVPLTAESEYVPQQVPTALVPEEELVEQLAVDVAPVLDEPSAAELSVVYTEPLHESTSEPQEEDTVPLPPLLVVEADPVLVAPPLALSVVEEVRESQLTEHGEISSPDVKAELPPSGPHAVLSISEVQTIKQASSMEHDAIPSSNGSLSIGWSPVLFVFVFFRFS
ncbi:uncharacterized protein BT62DRAFT_955226 [Guyanagaster necrorhizus]|uniref:Meiotically up-regulated protein Msb1/Mug8 domain-containing protein n=1 Tax=Guyanagaster necrorhizus TaxID=856835 RepID=A0A9P7VKK5_9AGAR|nr:uncharacterized protein BT62DRAFT_955226 [Guyanagaster necrorhizus MCA 3950]KAG7442065.1 hypothetical protein BT62DRAFT_955226 [Guyanagaster necrorhizus MCA 3950]